MQPYLNINKINGFNMKILKIYQEKLRYINYYVRKYY
jgi:hypothetical protein